VEFDRNCELIIDYVLGFPMIFYVEELFGLYALVSQTPL
jgi:hypothetical protein